MGVHNYGGPLTMQVERPSGQNQRLAVLFLHEFEAKLRGIAPLCLLVTPLVSIIYMDFPNGFADTPSDQPSKGSAENN